MFTEEKAGTLQQWTFAKFRRKDPAQDTSSGRGGRGRGVAADWKNQYLPSSAGSSTDVTQGDGGVIRLAGAEGVERVEKDKEHLINTQ